MFDVHLFLQITTLIGWNISRDLFQLITVAACKNKWTSNYKSKGSIVIALEAIEKVPTRVTVTERLLHGEKKLKECNGNSEKSKSLFRRNLRRKFRNVVKLGRIRKNWYVSIEKNKNIYRIERKQIQFAFVYVTLVYITLVQSALWYYSEKYIQYRRRCHIDCN